MIYKQHTHLEPHKPARTEVIACTNCILNYLCLLTSTFDYFSCSSYSNIQSYSLSCYFCDYFDYYHYYYYCCYSTTLVRLLNDTIANTKTIITSIASMSSQQLEQQYE